MPNKLYDGNYHWKKRNTFLYRKKIIKLYKKSCIKTKPEKLLNVEDAHIYNKKLLRKWATEK